MNPKPKAAPAPGSQTNPLLTRRTEKPAGFAAVNQLLVPFRASVWCPEFRASSSLVAANVAED